MATGLDWFQHTGNPNWLNAAQRQEFRGSLWGYDAESAEEQRLEQMNAIENWEDEEVEFTEQDIPAPSLEDERRALAIAVELEACQNAAPGEETPRKPVGTQLDLFPRPTVAREEDAMEEARRRAVYREVA